MQINWIELRNKKSGVTLRKTTFNKVNCLNGDDAAIDFIFNTITGAAQFAVGQSSADFLDVISRIDFTAAHNEYLWFAKNTSDANGKTITDEEELYDSNSNMLMRRGFGEMTIGDDETAIPIDLTSSMLPLYKDTLPSLAAVTAAFSHINYFKATEETQETLVQIILDLPHGAVVLLDGRGLKQPFDLTLITAKRQDIQCLAANSTGGAILNVVQKGNMISCK